MANEKVLYWDAVVELPDHPSRDLFLNPATPTFCARVCPIAADKLQASHRAANMLGLRWQKSARYIRLRGPFKASAQQIREWNATYPAWSIERDAASAPSGNLPPRGKA